MPAYNNIQKKKQQDIIDINAQYGRKPPEAEELEGTERGAGGFGSTGT